MAIACLLASRKFLTLIKSRNSYRQLRDLLSSASLTVRLSACQMRQTAGPDSRTHPVTATHLILLPPVRVLLVFYLFCGLVLPGVSRALAVGGGSVL